jgi:hypothetical protein
MLTDYVLGAVTAWLGFRLLRSNRGWAVAFLALAAGAFMGGTWHGFVRSELLGTATALSIGVTSFAMVAGSAVAVSSGRLRAFLLGFAAVQFCVYAGWMLFHDAYIYVVIDTGIALAIVAALHLWRFNGWMLAGVAGSLAAGLVQASGFALHQHFNHNDLYHVIQLAAMFLFYRGVRALGEPPRDLPRGDERH